MIPFRTALFFLVLLYGVNSPAAEFMETFEGRELTNDPSAREGWTWMTGDGEAVMTFSQADGIGVINVDAREDSRNIWWAFIRRSISSDINSSTLARPDRELRVEAKIRTSVAPRRVNLHFNHSRTTDYHSHLMEFDIPVEDRWHVISMTTKGFNAMPGDEVFVQMALMDWGRKSYRVEIDYLEVSVVDPAVAGPDLGEPLPYRPATFPTETYAHGIGVLYDATVDTAWPEENFKGWINQRHTDSRPLIFVGGTKIALLRWDLQKLGGGSPQGWGVLELTTEQIYGADTGIEELGELRVVEILGGDPGWSREMVTWNDFLAGQEVGDVLNSQTMIDVSPVTVPGGKTQIAVSPPVLRRLLSGRTRGLAIQAQGAVIATFYSGDSSDAEGPKLFFNLD